jgi:hypothetical protein
MAKQIRLRESTEVGRGTARSHCSWTKRRATTAGTDVDALDGDTVCVEVGVPLDKLVFAIELADKTNIDTACESDTACGRYIHKNTQFSNTLALLMALKCNRISNL